MYCCFSLCVPEIRTANVYRMLGGSPHVTDHDTQMYHPSPTLIWIWIHFSWVVYGYTRPITYAPVADETSNSFKERKFMKTTKKFLSRDPF